MRELNTWRLCWYLRFGYGITNLVAEYTYIFILVRAIAYTTMQAKQIVNIKDRKIISDEI